MSYSEKQRWRDDVLRDLNAQMADASERVKVQAALAQEGLKALVLANGGAIIALFTFVGNALSKPSAMRFSAAMLHHAFLAFAVGFTLSLAAYIVAFASQDRFYRVSMAEVQRLSKSLREDEPIVDQWPARRHLRIGGCLYLLGAVVSAATVAAFGSGCWFALQGVLI